MICLDEGILRAHCDGELSAYETLSVQRHLTLCPDCQHLYETVAARVQRLGDVLTELGPLPDELRTDAFAAQWAFTRFKAHYDVSFDYPVFAPTPTREFTFLLAQESLLTRLRRELRTHWQEFNQAPLQYLAQLLRGETNTAMRRQHLRTGTATAMASYALMFTTLIVAGVIRNANQTPELVAEPVHFIKLTSPAIVETTPQNPPEYALKGKGGLVGGSKDLLDPARGGGGGGRNDAQPLAQGRTPQFDPQLQLLPPDARTPQVVKPALVLPETLLGDPALARNFAGRTGLPDGADVAGSGSGKNAGIGTGYGTGMGSGDGAGFGPGQVNNKGTGEKALGGGLGKQGNSPGGSEIYDATHSLQPVILARERAHYTEAARQHGIRGSVYLSAVFGADGRLYNIQIIRQLPHGLTESAIEAARRIRFRPALKNGVPVNVRMQMEFNFNLY